MAIDIEFLLARHPLLLLGREGCVKGFHSSGVLTAVGGGGRNVHPLFTVECIRHKLSYKQSSREVSVHDETDVLPFAAYETTADVVARIAEIDVHIVAHLASNLKGMLDQHFAELLPLIFGSNAKRSEGKNLLALAKLVLKSSLRVHDVAHNSAVKLEHECKLGDKVEM